MRKRLEETAAAHAGGEFFARFLSKSAPQPRVRLAPNAVIEFDPGIIEIAEKHPGIVRGFFNGMAAAFCAEKGAELGSRITRERGEEKGK